MEVQTVPYSWLGALDRKYGRPGEARQTPFSDSRPTPLDFLPPETPPGSRPLPPSLHTARQLFEVGRRFRLLLGTPARLTCPWVVVAQKELTLQFRAVECPRERLRSVPWRSFESHVLEDRVRWLSNAHQLLKRRS